MQSNVQFTHDNIPPLPEGPPPAHFTRDQMQPGEGIPRFDMVAKRRPDGTYENVEYVTILTPGDPKAMPRHKVNDHIRQKYAAHYDLFRRGLEVAPQGTPLEMWPSMTPAQVATLKALNIFTVEQLADVADANLHRIPMGQTLKLNAKKWLALKQDSDAVEKQVRENQMLRDNQAMLEKQIAALAERLEGAEKRANTVETEDAPKRPNKKES